MNYWSTMTMIGMISNRRSSSDFTASCNKQDACRGVHSACRREVNRHKLDICVLRPLTTAQAGADPGIFVCRSNFSGPKVERGLD